MKIGLDIDGTISENVEFFATLSQSDRFEVHIITGRDPADKIETLEELTSLGINFHTIHYADGWEDKGRICKELGLEVIFDDQDEYITHIPCSTLVFKPRNGGNWNAAKMDWLTKPANACEKKTSGITSEWLTKVAKRNAEEENKRSQ